MAKKTSGPPKMPTGDYPSGYARPPEAGKIKPGEVRNRHGRNGKPKPGSDDPFEGAMAQRTTVTIAGVRRVVSAEQAMHLRHAAKAIEGNDASFRVLATERRSRRAAGPPPPTDDERAASAQEQKQREVLSARLIGLLQLGASLKKAGLLEIDEGPLRLAEWITAEAELRRGAAANSPD